MHDYTDMRLPARGFPLFVLISTAAAFPAFAQSLITTAVGSDLFFQGNGKPAASVALGRVQRVAADSSGRPVFADPNYNLVFRVNGDGTIQTIAGNNVQGLETAGTMSSGGGYSGDGGPATQAALNRPAAAVYDSSGNLYIADSFNNMIRVVSPANIISRYAGTGAGLYSGDNGSAVNATLQTPTDLAVDSSGNLYINDSNNFVIRKVTPQGTISTVAGTGSLDTTCPSPTPTVAAIPSATSVALGYVNGLAVDAKGNVYFSECTGVREISGGAMSAVPLGSTTLSRPAGLAFDAAGELVIVDETGQRIYKLAGGSLTVVGGNGQAGFSGDGGQAASAMFQDPYGLAVTSSGAILVADLDNYRVRQINTQGLVSTIASNGTLISGQNNVSAALATLYNPFGINFDAAGDLLIADTYNGIVRRMGAAQTLAIVAGTGVGASNGNGGPATQAALAYPITVTADAAGDLFIAEDGRGLGANDIRKVAAPSGTIASLGSRRPGLSLSDRPRRRRQPLCRRLLLRRGHQDYGQRRAAGLRQQPRRPRRSGARCGGRPVRVGVGGDAQRRPDLAIFLDGGRPEFHRDCRRGNRHRPGGGWRTGDECRPELSRRPSAG